MENKTNLVGKISFQVCDKKGNVLKEGTNTENKSKED